MTGRGASTARKSDPQRTKSSPPPQRVALVTGGNRGIGLEVCRQLASRGHRVVLTARDAAKAQVAARSIDGDVHALALDITSESSIQTASRRALDEFGAVDILVNNAAILLHENDDFVDIPLDAYRATFETNVLGAIAVAQALLPRMLERRYGRIVNVSSSAGQLSSMTTYAPAYSISKAALNAVTLQMAAATRGRGILVNSACPGWVRTDMGGPNAPRSVEEGADTIVWLATLPDGGPTGGFFQNRKPFAW